MYQYDKILLEIYQITVSQKLRDIILFTFILLEIFLRILILRFSIKINRCKQEHYLPKYPFNITLFNMCIRLNFRHQECKKNFMHVHVTRNLRILFLQKCQRVNLIWKNNDWCMSYVFITRKKWIWNKMRLWLNVKLKLRLMKKYEITDISPVLWLEVFDFLD